MSLFDLLPIGFDDLLKGIGNGQQPIIISIQYSSLGFNLHVKALYILDLGLVKEDILFGG